MSVSDVSALDVQKASRLGPDRELPVYLHGNGQPPASPRSSLFRRLRDAAGLVYDRAAVGPLSLFRRSDAVASRSHDGRRIPLRLDKDGAPPLVDPRRGNAFVSNSIRTSRYTVWDFVPKQLLFQFSRIGNFYFLCVGIPQMIPGLSTTGSYTTILPLLFFVFLTMFKEGYDDYRRHRLDKIENACFAITIGTIGTKDRYTEKPLQPTGLASRLTSRLDRFNPFTSTGTAAEPRPCPAEEDQGLTWVPTRWAEIKVGDVLLLARDEPVPADIVLLHSDGENGLAYVDTMALDGETSLKSKQVCHAIHDCDTIAGIANCRAEFVVEHPNPDLFSYDGKVTVDDNGKSAVPITMDNVIYRGSVVRNTSRAIGIVVNTGEDCKVRMNANRHPKAKRPALESVVNGIVLILAVYVVLLAVGVSMGYVHWHRSYERDAWYLDDASVPFYQIIIAFIIMFNNVIPLSLYVSLEIVKIGQLLLLNSDIEMYDEETDTPARCNTNTILENLGQVGYVFSDKTGTLTDNVMKFRKISVAGTVWLHEMDLDLEEPLEPAPDIEPIPIPIPIPTSGVENAAYHQASSAVSPLLHREAEQNLPARRQSAAYRRTERMSLAIPEDQPETGTETTETDQQNPVSSSTMPASMPAPSGRRSSSHWRSTGRPDHVQPEVNTTDLLEYIRLRPHSAFARKARDYILAMALCHSCLPEHNKDGRVDFQASSPDELALVRAAQEMGFLVVQRNSRQITLQVTSQPDGRTENMVYEILDVIEFSSARKRMSVVVRFPDGRVAVICKGADSAILPRLRLSSLAMQKAQEVRQSAEVEREMYRRSEQMEPRNSFGGRPSLSVRRRENRENREKSGTSRSKSFELNTLLSSRRASVDQPRTSLNRRGVSFDVTASSAYVSPANDRLAFLDDPSIYDESEVFTKCFKHLDDFATEGLRTLLFAQKFVSEQEYRSWKKLYDDATTSLTNRQERIEAAGEMIEQSLELVGGSAIEDKLQKGVPETVDRLRRANIKIWMLTGDKRETAINIAHSARICRPGSDLFILDAAKGSCSLEEQLSAMMEDLAAGSLHSHSVVVIDGQSLAVVEKSDDLRHRFFSAMVRVDSVICCRASPAQKALLVQAVRAKLAAAAGKFWAHRPQGLTLAIGDGANDLAMIQASHVGVGISGKEGLQASRVADYAIAQFRFLQRMLLVHGRWNYVRTAKFIVCSFWKEMFFYLPTALYQRHAGYTGSSLYEATSLTVFNTFFTSLASICMGIWEQDLSAETLLALPELYVFGQRDMGLNFFKYMRWMALAAVEGVIVWYGIWAGYGTLAGGGPRDDGLYALGSLTFTIGVLWINWKLFIFEIHYKPAVVLVCFFITTGGWFLWLSFLSEIYPASPSGKYAIRSTFTKLFGLDGAWWATVFIVLGILGMLELVFKVARRGFLVMGMWRWPPWKGLSRGRGRPAEEWDVEVWQELEQDAAVRRRLIRMAGDKGDGEDEEEEEMDFEGIEIEVSSR